ncbi:Trichothecene efflux pump TRI12 [Fusarium oxysporum f. sp. rapae]|uniref:Trichothecene efflux pump TRI12 n=1 Tax=Fusarium oxysporum f. sp. rapae TaxID=485398 RepID=A0A8J5NSZ6_FUSOX|nr:Trichothecene efflux pump TRI12 [Fusarium oxysporum f. sp. rapae]
MTSQSSIHAPFEQDATRIHSKTMICLFAVNIIYLTQILSLVGTGLLANTMAQVVGGTGQTVWYSSCITILTVVLNPPIGQVADYWGRKAILVVMPLAGVVGSIIVSRAQSSGTLIAGFAILGLNYGSQSLSVAVMSEILPRHYRPIGQAVGSVSTALGAIIALLMGGGLLRHGDNSNYRIFWYVTAGLYALASLGCVIGYNPPPRDLQVSLDVSQKLKSLDWVGYALFAPALVLFCIALSWSQNPYSWDSANILAPFIISIVALIIFIVYEWRFKKDGMLHHELWRHRNFAISLFVIFVEGIAFFAANSYFVFQISLVYDVSFLSGSVNFAILFIAAGVFSPVFGLWSSKRKTLRPPLVLGAICLLAFFILLATSKIDTPRYAFWIYPILPGIALPSIVPLSMVSAQFATTPELIALTSALMTSIRSLGGSIGLAINNAVLHNALDKELPKKIAEAALPLGLPASSLPALIQGLASQNKQAVAAVPGLTPEIAQAAVVGMKKAYLIAFRNAWIVSASFCALLLISCFFIKEQESEFDASIDAPVEINSKTLEVDEILPPNMQEKQFEGRAEVSHQENSSS